MRTLRVAYLGFGTVNRALHALLARRRRGLADEHGLSCETVGVATRTAGWLETPADYDPASAESGRSTSHAGLEAWLDAIRPDVVFEAIALDPHAGEPALSHTRAILSRGINVVSANKGPVVHGYRELSALAREKSCAYRFEASVMDGAPVFSLVRDCLPLAGISGVRGVFTSTATVVLEAVEQGLSPEQGIERAQRLGIAEEDPSFDIDGWDSAVKLCAVGNVLLDADLRPEQVARAGIRDLAVADVVRAKHEGSPFRLVGDVRRDEHGRVSARVAPERCRADGPLGIVHGPTLVMRYDADVFPGGLVVTSRDPDATTTAYGMFADLLRLPL